MCANIIIKHAVKDEIWQIHDVEKFLEYTRNIYDLFYIPLEIYRFYELIIRLDIRPLFAERIEHYKKLRDKYAAHPYKTDMNEVVEYIRKTSLQKYIMTDIHEMTLIAKHLLGMIPNTVKQADRKADINYDKLYLTIDELAIIKFTQFRIIKRLDNCVSRQLHDRKRKYTKNHDQSQENFILNYKKYFENIDS